jgi:hypothetical protein
MINNQDILKLKKQLLPKGRAFNVPIGGYFEKLLLGLGGKESEAYNQAIGLLNSIIPDNIFFSTEDAAYWERTLSISSSLDDSITNRMAAIYRKMTFPGNTKGRQHKYYLQGQLRAANFPVTIYEFNDIKNRITNEYHSLDTVHSVGTRHGGMEIPFYTGVIANFLDPTNETPIEITLANLKNVFWIAGNTFDDYVNIPLSRIEEFRNIVLTIKPLHTVAFLRVLNADNWILAGGTWNNAGFFYNSSIWS